MAKRFYKTGEFVWLKKENKKGKVIELDIANLQAKVSMIIDKDETGYTFKETIVKFEDMDKLRSKETVSSKPNNGYNPTILFAKVRDTAIIPSKEDENAGYDIYANFEGDSLVIPPNTIKLVPTGIASSLTDDYALIVKERGSTGTKGMAVRAGVVDSGYRGEIFVAINNTSNKDIAIVKEGINIQLPADTIVYPYNKAIAQLLLVNVPKSYVKEITFEELQKIPSKRKDTKLGQSNK